MKPNVVWPGPGRYILAVSGGADSMVLLDLMAAAATARGYELLVAHFDHGIRPDSRDDRLFVQGAAKRYGLPFEHRSAKLGQASEATARTARHAWLEQVRADHQADAVVTAHHQDDLLETSLLNLARGTGPRGLAPMQDGRILRPLIRATRADLRTYANEHKIAWREDPTNADTTNPRNFLRHELLQNANPKWRACYLELVGQLGELNKKVAQSISVMLDETRAGASNFTFPRRLVRDLSLDELAELITAAARALAPGADLDRRLVQEITLFAKTAPPHRHRPLRHGLMVRVEPGAVSITCVPTATNVAT